VLNCQTAVARKEFYSEFRKEINPLVGKHQKRSHAVKKNNVGTNKRKK
jgi:hypothetical protein